MLARAPNPSWMPSWIPRRLLVPCLACGLASTASAGPPPPAAGSGDTAKTGAAAAPPSPGTPPAATSGAPPKSATPPKPTQSTVPPAPSKAGEPSPSTSSAPAQPEGPPVDLSHTWSRSRGGGNASPRFVRNPEARVEIANPEGYYSGVSVEGNHVPPFPAAKMGSKPAILTWTGFERTGNGSRVFFQVSAAVATKLTVTNGVLTLRLVNTKINVKNNSRNLDLRYFETPVRSVKVKRSGKDTVATIVLKRGAEPKVATVDGKAGYKLVVVEFAESGSDVPAPPPPP